MSGQHGEATKFLKRIFIGYSIVVARLTVDSEPCNATSIVGFWTQGQVVIAADSLRGHVDANGQITSQTAGCKIYADSHGVFFAAAGTSLTLDGNVTSIEGLVRKVKFAGTTKAEQVQDAINELHSNLALAWSDAYKNAPEFFRSTIQCHAAQAIFGWIDGGQIGAASYSSTPLPGGRNNGSTSAVYPMRGASRDSPVWMAGGSNAELMDTRLNAMVKNHESLPADVPEFARQLIKLEIDGNIARHPDGKGRSVGWPIDVLVINQSNGPHWYRRQVESQCPELP